MTHKSSSILLVLVAILEFGLGPISIEAAGTATVRDVLPCPPIEAQSASGVHESVVTGTFRHTAMSTVELSFEGSIVTGVTFSMAKMAKNSTTSAKIPLKGRTSLRKKSTPV